MDTARARTFIRAYPIKTATATMRALNRALTTGTATLSRLIAADMGLKVSDVKAAIKSRAATTVTLEVRLAASLRRLPLVQFNAKGPMPSRGRGRGVTYRIGSQGRTRAEHAFLARMASGHVGVYKRTGPGRLPIVQLYGPSIGHVFTKHQQAGVDAMRESFNKNLAHELDYIAKAAR